MAYFRLTLTAAVLLICACAVQESLAMNWKSHPQMQAFMVANPKVKRMTEGPLGPVIDIIIQILVQVLQIILANIPNTPISQ